MCPSNYKRFSDKARYWSKIVIFSYSLAFDTQLGGSRRYSATPFGTEKLEWGLGYPMVKIIRRYLYSFWRNSHERDGRTPGDGIYRAYAYASRGKNRSSGFAAVGGRKSPFPITLAIALYNSLYYRTSRDLIMHDTCNCCCTLEVKGQRSKVRS